MVSSVISSVPNYSLYSVPAMWVVSFLPHPYAIACAGDRFKNAAPRQMMADLLAKKDKTDTDKKVIRAESAQANGFENLGWFAAAVVAANYAGVPNSELNNLTGAYIGSRILYNLLYIFVQSEATATLRSGSYLAGIGIIFSLFIKAGNRLG